MGYSPWGCKESDTTERLHFTSLHFSYLGSVSCVSSSGVSLGCTVRGDCSLLASRWQEVLRAHHQGWLQSLITLTSFVYCLFMAGNILFLTTFFHAFIIKRKISEKFLQEENV